jgi:hypothetical protein
MTTRSDSHADAQAGAFELLAVGLLILLLIAGLIH